MPHKLENTPDQAVRGVFQTAAMATLGFGETKRRVKQAVYIYAEETTDGRIACQALSPRFIPQGEKSFITKDELFKDYTPAPHIYLNKVLPAMAALEESVDVADHRLRDGELFSAEFEYKNALRIDENHIRATFGLGITYLERGDSQNADTVFRKLSGLKGSFSPEYKHLFNEFGIKLRKNGMVTQALGYYAKALRLSPQDENLYYNFARALYATGRIRAAKRVLNKALSVRPAFPEALKLREFIEEKVLKTASGVSAPGSIKPEIP